MTKTNLYAALLALPLLIVATESFAWQNNGFSGSRDQVRIACGKIGGELIEGLDETHCFNHSNGAGVTCDDDNSCDGGGPGPAPRIYIGMGDAVAVAIGKVRRAPQDVPESLVYGPNDSGAVATGPSEDDIISGF